MKKIGISVAVSVAVSVSEQKTKIPPEAGYYFSENGNDANDGLSPETPKKSLSEISGLDFTSIKNVFLERDGEFDGTINIPVSGTAQVPFTINSYGTGKKPIINSSVKLNGAWTLDSGNIYKYNVTDDLNHVYLNGERLKNSRYPNQGYFYIDDVVSGTSVSVNDLDDGIDYTGASLHTRTVQWILSTRVVSNSSSRTLTVDSAPQYGFAQDNPVFLTNHYAFLEEGTWYYDSANKVLYVWTPDGTSPANYDIRVSYNERSIYADAKDNVAIKNIAVRHSKSEGIWARRSSNIIIENVDVSYTGSRGIYVTDCVNVKINNNYIKRTLDDGIMLNTENISFNGGIVQANGNVIEDIALMNDISINGVGTCNGMFIRVKEPEVKWNYLKNIGYNGIQMYRSINGLVQYNVIKDFCMLLNDGGGIYTWVGQTANLPKEFLSDGLQILNNIIDGTNEDGTLYDKGYENPRENASGIYFDEGSTEVIAKYNVIARVGIGLFMHQTLDCVMEDNLIFDANSGIHDGQNNTFSDNNTYIYNEIVLAKETSDYYIGTKIQAQTARARNQNQHGMFDYNTYVSRHGSNVFRTLSDGNFVSFATWQSAINGEGNSSFISTALGENETEKLIYNGTDENKTFYLNKATSVADNITDDAISSNIVLAPFEGKVLRGVNVDTVLDYEDNIAPVITEFEIPATYNELTVPITKLEVTGEPTMRIITRSATVPELTDPDWKRGMESITFNSTGEKTVYLWVRDEAGNISNYVMAQVTIEIEFPAGDKLVHAWEFNEAVGSDVADSKGSNDGTATGTVIVDGLMGKARSFNGSSDNVAFSFPSEIDINLTKDFSVSMWVNLQDRTQYGVLLDMTYNWRTAVMLHQNYNGGAYIFTVYKYQNRIGSLVSPAINTDEFVHIVLTWDAAEEEMGFYVNGINITAISQDYIGQGATAGMTIGMRADGQNHSEIISDQTLFFDEVLTEQEVENLFNDGNGIEL